MAEDNDDSKLSSVKYYVLKDENAATFYDEWKFKTMAIIRKKGWGGHLDDPTINIPTRTEVLAETATDATKKVYKDNTEAFDQILMGCSGVPLGLVRRANGNSRVALSNLDKKYGRTKSDLTETLSEFTKCRLVDTEHDPDKWFMELDRINDKLGDIDFLYRKKDYELKAHMLGYLPDGYADVRTKLSGKEESLTVSEVEDEIRNKWKREFKSREDTSGNLAMTVSNGRIKKKFKGKCRKCGKQGHKAAECRSSKQGVCFECGEDGHFARDCPNKKEAAKMGMFVGITMSAVDTKATGNGKFLLDSGASCHVVTDERLLVETEDTNDSIIIGDKSEMAVTKQGVLHLTTKCGNEMRLNDVKVVPSMAKNIISVGKLMSEGNKVSMSNTVFSIENGCGDKIEVKKDAENLLFYLEAKVNTMSEVYNNEERKKPTTREIDINDAHVLYGHASEGPLREILRQRNYVAVGTRRTCEACAYAKAKAKAVGKTTKLKAQLKGERLFIDISGPYKKTLVSSKYWILVVDDKTRKAWSFFVRQKKEIGKVASSLIQLLKGAKVITKYMRCDNAGENIKQLRDVCEKGGITMEMTAPNTPQMNGVVERKFVTIRDKAVAMMLGAMLDDEHQGQLWAEAIHTATKLENAIPNSRSNESPDYQWYSEHPGLLNHLVQWGRIGYITIHMKQNKLSKKSIKCVCMGYADDHSSDTYRFYNPVTNKILLSRDVTWAEWHGSQQIPTSLKMFAQPDDVDVTDDQIGEDVPPTTHPGAGPHVIPAEDDDEAGRNNRTEKNNFNFNFNERD